MTLNELLLGGPGHDGYAYNADVYCVDCGQDIIRACYPHIRGDEDAQRDTESCPQPIFFGESDAAQHCAECGEYLYGPQEEEEPDDPDGLDAFLRAYVECALFASTDEQGEALDGLYTSDDLAPGALAHMRADCIAFLRDNADDIGERYARAGSDFWLTRNHHGAGFWDGDWAPEVGRRLTDAAHAYGSSDPYVGDDGSIHLQGEA